MDRSTPINLITETLTQNEIGEWIPTETKKAVFANVKNVTSTEFFNAGQVGLNPEYRFVMFFGDYSGEEIVEFNSVRYHIYRVYKSGTDTIELYAERKVGTFTAEPTPTPTPTPTPSEPSEGDEP